MELSARRTAPPAARCSLREDETGFCAVTWGDGDLGGPRSAPEALERLDSTEEFWREWLRDGDFPDHPWRIHLQRSALVLKGLTYTPTGAIVAAPTTSLPETPGGERNWDYRFSWIRDSTFSLWALHTLGFDQEARDFMRFIVDVCRDDPDLQIMYGIGGEKELDREHARPPRRLRRRHARCGSATAPTTSARTTSGARCSTRSTCTKRRCAARGTPADRELIRYQVEAAIAAWPAPRPGDLGVARRAPALRLLEADDLGRGRPRRPPRPRRRLRRARRRVAGEGRRDSSAEILERGVRDGVFRQHYETDALDASTLLIPLLRFLPPDDPRVRRHGRGDRRRPDRARPRPPLQGRGDRRRPAAARRGPS